MGFIFYFLVFLVNTVSLAGDLPVGSSLGGVDSQYTQVLRDLVQKWPPPGSSSKSSDVKSLLDLECYSTPKEPYYIGVKQTMWILAPFEAVEKVVDDIDHYKDIFPDFVETRREKSENNKFLTYWEQTAPFILLSNNKFKMVYLVSKPTKKHKVYRYQFLEGNYLKKSDGFIDIEEIESGKTRYIEYDFWDADWGIAKSLGAEHKIWIENIKGNVLSDLGIRLKAEHSDWDGEKVRDEAEKLLEQIEFEEAVSKRKPWENKP